MAYKLPTIDLKNLAQQKKEGLLKGSSTPAPNNILSGSPVITPAQKPQTLLTLKQPLPAGTAQKLEDIKTRLPQKVQPVAPVQSVPVVQTTDTRPPMTKAEKIRRANIMVDAGATQEEIQAYVSQFKTSDGAQSPQGNSMLGQAKEIAGQVWTGIKKVGSDIADVSDGSIDKTREEQGVIGKSLTDINTRASNVERIESEMRAEGGFQPRQEYRRAGQLLGAASDVFGNVFSGAVETVVPKSLREQGKEVIGLAGETELGQDVKGTAQTAFEKYQQFKQNNPELAKDVEATGNIAEFVLNFVGVGGAGKVASKGDDFMKGVRGEVETIVNKSAPKLKSIKDYGVKRNAKVVEKNVAKNKAVFEGVRNTQTGEKILEKADDRGFNPIDDVSRYEDLAPKIDADGHIDTTQAIDNLDGIVQPKAQTVRKLIEAEGKRVNFDTFVAETRDILERKFLDDPDYDRWLKYVDDTLESYRNKKGYLDPNGTIALEKIDDIKKTIANKKVNYLNENDQALKSIAEGARRIIEKNVSNADIKALNNELARWYTTRDYLMSIGRGKTIKGGRLGKYFAKMAGQGAGAVLGGTIGGGTGAFVGGAVGGELASAIQGKILSGAIKGTKQAIPESQLFGKAKATLGESPKMLMPPTGKPTSSPSIYSKGVEQLGQVKLPSKDIKNSPIINKNSRKSKNKL